MRRVVLLAFVILPFLWCEASATAANLSNPHPVSKQVKLQKKPDPLQLARTQLFQQMEALYGVPWVYLAAIDQYERSLQKRGKKQKQLINERLTAISIPPAIWCGYLNPDADDQDESSIDFFGGIGKDGSGDDKADPANDLDVLYTIIQFLTQYGFAPEDFSNGLWNYYKRDRAVKTINQFVGIYDKYQELNLSAHAFPIPRKYSYSYNNTWGDARGWGGRRIHEGTDIFAGYGTPVLSTSYGTVEMMGWNRFGGWRIGIRDINNIYHYFAHLSSFKKGIKAGDIVEPGQVIGYVGSSGYGKPGTSGKFPPHLHYGMYRDTGSDEWAFNPYSYLTLWERQRSRKQ